MSTHFEGICIYNVYFNGAGIKVEEKFPLSPRHASLLDDYMNSIPDLSEGKTDFIVRLANLLSLVSEPKVRKSIHP